MVQADSLVLNHDSGRLMYSIRDGQKNRLSENCIRISVETPMNSVFEADGKFTFVEFEIPVEVEIDETPDGDVAKIGGYK